MKSGLKYDWYARLGEMSWRIIPAPVDRINAALDWAAYFIDEWADLAERHQWQPAHLLRPHQGLAWRVPDTIGYPPSIFPVLGFHGHVCALQVSGLIFTYRPARDGSITLLTGRHRRAVLEKLGLRFGSAPIPEIHPDCVAAT